MVCCSLARITRESYAYLSENGHLTSFVYLDGEYNQKDIFHWSTAAIVNRQVYPKCYSDSFKRFLNKKNELLAEL